MSILEDYRTLLERAMSKIQGRREAMPHDLPDLEVEYAGTKTIVRNLQQISQRLNRSPRIIARYFLKELASPGTINPAGALEIWGSGGKPIRKTTLQNMFSRFIQTYVRCSTCGSIDTDLIRRGKIWTIKCLACGAELTVEAI